MSNAATRERSAGLARRFSALAAVLALAGCNAPDKAYRGWYIEQGSGAFFQPCGESTRYRVDSSELRSRASAFGLGVDNPVYVRLRGRQSPSGRLLVISRIEMFGSATPIRDCPMTGLMIAAPG